MPLMLQIQLARSEKWPLRLFFCVAFAKLLFIRFGSRYSHLWGKVLSFSVRRFSVPV